MRRRCSSAALVAALALSGCATPTPQQEAQMGAQMNWQLEHEAYLLRYQRIMAEDNPTLIRADEKRWAENLDYSHRKPSQSLETFRRVRAENYELLKDLPESAYSRIGTHNLRGQTTLLDWLQIFAVHAEKHTQQIRDTRAAFKQAKAAGGQ